MWIIRSAWQRKKRNFLYRYSLLFDADFISISIVLNFRNNLVSSSCSHHFQLSYVCFIWLAGRRIGYGAVCGSHFNFRHILGVAFGGCYCYFTCGQMNRHVFIRLWQFRMLFIEWKLSLTANVRWCECVCVIVWLCDCECVYAYIQSN